MPFYKLPNRTGSIHIKFAGKNPPPPCEAMYGDTDVCGWISGYQCDGLLDNGNICDRYLCDAHAQEIGKNKHLCPECLLREMRVSPELPLFTVVLDRRK